MRQGSIVAISYTGKVVVSGAVFESTVEKRAIEAGIFNEKRKYEPLVIVVGEGDVLKGLDNALLEMRVGEQREVKVSPQEGWGERKPGNTKVVPLQQFKQQKMQPFPGLVVEVNGMQGRVQSVSGGRVRVDFNHPLAGKDLLYDLKVERELVEPKEQIEALYSKYFGMVPKEEKSIEVGKGSVEVGLTPRWSANLGPLKQAFSRIVTKYVKGFEKVRFVEEFKQEKEAKSGAEKGAEDAEKKEPEKEAKKQGEGQERKAAEEAEKVQGNGGEKGLGRG